MGKDFYFRDPSSVSASPGFTWGRSGTVTDGTWLLNDTGPANKSGRRNFLSGAEVIKVFVSSEVIATFDVEVYEHTGIGTEVLLDTVSVVAKRSDDFSTSISLTTGKELSVKIANGTATNPQVGLIIIGKL